MLSRWASSANGSGKPKETSVRALSKSKLNLN